MTILLDDEDFKCLVRGGILTLGDLQIGLKDIGFDQMYNAIHLAEEGNNIYEGRTKGSNE